MSLPLRLRGGRVESGGREVATESYPRWLEEAREILEYLIPGQGRKPMKDQLVS